MLVEGGRVGGWETINLLCQESWNTLGKNHPPIPGLCSLKECWGDICLLN